MKLNTQAPSLVPASVMCSCNIISQYFGGEYMDPLRLLAQLAPIQYGWWYEEKKKIITWKDPEFKKPRFFEENCHVLKPEEVWARGCGTCWDLTLLIYDALSHMQFRELQTFYFEAKAPKGNVISTHTSVLFREPSSKQFFWFEFSWYQHRGIHGPYTSVDKFFDSLKRDYITSSGEKLLYLNPGFDAASLLKLDVITAEKFVEIARTQMK